MFIVTIKIKRLILASINITRSKGNIIEEAYKFSKNLLSQFHPIGY